MRDERTTQVMRQIHSELTMIMVLLCALSMVIKVLLFEKSIYDCMLEWIILVGAPVYQAIRIRMLKVSISNGSLNWKRNILSTLVSFIILLVLFGMTAVIHPDRMTPSFMLSFLVPYVILLFLLRTIFGKIEERRARKLEEEYDE